jgi:hypothetical protein
LRATAYLSTRQELTSVDDCAGDGCACLVRSGGSQRARGQHWPLILSALYQTLSPENGRR